MKIAVTSASGQLGSAIVKQLIEEIGKEQVIGIARTPKKAEPPRGGNKEGRLQPPRGF